MDLYTTSFTTITQAETSSETVKNLAEEVTAREGCSVTVTRANPGLPIGSPGPGRDGVKEPDERALVWNFHLSGSYQSVMNARGAVLRESPRDNRVGIKVARTEVMESSLGPLSELKPEVRLRLVDIVTEVKAEISVVPVGNRPLDGGEPGAADGKTQGISGRGNGRGMESSTESHLTGSPVSALGAEEKTTAGSTAPMGKTGEIPAAPQDLETERLCEIVITGALENVEVAKVRVLVMLDELNGLHAEPCDIDYQLHSIIGGRKRCVIQSIQEETATNIYFPTPLVGIYNTPRPGQQSMGNRHPSSNGGISIQNTGMSHISSATGFSQPSAGVNHGFNGGQVPLYPAQRDPNNRGGEFGPGHQAGMTAWNGSYSYPHSSQSQLHPHPLHSHNHNQLHQPQQSHFQHQHHHQQPHHHHHQQLHRQNGPSHSQQHHVPIYNPHHHVQYPYHPQPMSYDLQHHRVGMSMAHTGSNGQYFGQHARSNGMSTPISMQHTGMSSMTGYQPARGMPSPVDGSLGPPPPYGGPQYPASSQQRTPSTGMMGMTEFNGMSAIGGYTNHPFSHQDPHQPRHQPGQRPNLHVSMNNVPGHAGGMAGSMSYSGNTGMTGFVPHNGGDMSLNGFGQTLNPGFAVHGGEQGVMGKANQIWITGEFFGVQRARDMLLNIAIQKSKLVISRDTAILPRKLDWLLIDRLEEAKSIMSDNGTYMRVPPIGSHTSLITVFGDHRVNIERSIRSLMSLACEFYVASFWLLPLSYEALVSHPPLNPAQMQPTIKGIAHVTGAEVVFKNNCFELHGLEQQIRAAVSMILGLDVIKGFSHEIRFQIELANEHREFISGKKNGKINKIMKLANVRIKFETLNDYNFLMDIAGSDANALQGLSLLQEELPAEISFHVPELYHKRIIGVGGKNIQGIMKLFGVYVKFSNAEESAQLGGYAHNEDNVVARTPGKNAASLESLRQSVMELVHPKDRDYTTEAVVIPRRYHRALLGEKSIFLHDIEQKTNSIIRFPYNETTSDTVTMFGPESQLHIAAAMLLDHVPFEADLLVQSDSKLTSFISNPDFIARTESIKRDHQISISPSVKFGQADLAAFKFRCQRSNMGSLVAARDELEEFLQQNDIQLHPQTAGADSFMEAITIDSKLPHTPDSLTSLENGAEVIAPPSQRGKAGSTDVKAIFEGHSASSSIGSAFRAEDAGSMGFAGPLSYDPRRMSDLWQPTQISSQPMRSEPETTSKRDSDPIIQDKMRQATMGPGVPLSHSPHSHNHGHVLSHGVRGSAARTQSLDITSLNFSRALSSTSIGPFGPMPPSPAAIGDNSPVTATGGQFFPSSSTGSGGSSTVIEQAQSQGGGGVGGAGQKAFGFDSSLDGVSHCGYSSCFRVPPPARYLQDKPLQGANACSIW